MDMPKPSVPSSSGAWLVPCEEEQEEGCVQRARLSGFVLS